MRLLLIAARKDLARRLTDIPALALWLGIPLAIGVLLFVISGGPSGQPAPKATVLIVDLDGSFLSGLVVSGASSGRLGEMFDVERVTNDVGERRIAAGDVSALVVLPKGFGNAVLNETAAEIRLVTNPSQRILPGIVKEGLEVLVEAAFYAQRIFGEQLRAMASGPAGGPSNAQVAQTATAINDKLRVLNGLVVPPVLSVVTQSSPAAAPGPNFGQVFVPGILMLAVLFVAQGTSEDIWAERAQGTLRRAVSLPGPLSAFLAGKLLAGSAIVGAAICVGLAVAGGFFGVAVARLPLAFLWTWVAGICLLCYFALLQTVASSQRGGQLLTTMVVFPLMMLGGSLFPLDMMPPWLAAIGTWTPNGLAAARLREILDGRVLAGPLLLSLTGLCVPAAAAFWLAARRLGNRLAVN